MNAQEDACGEQTNAPENFFIRTRCNRDANGIVLRDGEGRSRIIEWYDRICVKVNARRPSQTSDYKPAIKYM